MVERPLERDRRTAHQERCVHHVAVADDPADVRGGPPDVGRSQAEAPATHADDMDLVAAVRVNGQLGPSRGARRREDERRLVRFHRFVFARLAVAAFEKRVPRHVARCIERSRRRATLQHDDMLDHVGDQSECFVHDRREVEFLALAIGDVGREHEPRAAGLNTFAERARTEAGEDDRVDRADADRREHQHDGLGRGRHVDRQPIAFAEAEPAQRRRRARHAFEQFGKCKRLFLAALVEVDQRRVRTAAVGDVVIERVIGEVCVRADEPAERREGPFERAVPLPEPRQRRRPRGTRTPRDREARHREIAERLASPSETE